MPRKINWMFPRREEGAVWLYIVGGTDGTVKVGKTRDLKSRVSTHRQAMGEGFAWVHVFPQKQSGHVEWSALRRLASIGTRSGRTETFRGIAKDVAIRECRALVHERIESERRWAEQRQKQAHRDAAWRAFRAQYLGEQVAEPAKAEG